MENMELHADLYDVPRDVMHTRIDEVLQLVQLKNRASNYVNTYSGGMRRRLEIARSLIHYPKVLFLDEPTVGLDPQSRDHIWNYIRELKKQESITIILTTHYMEEADKLCDRIAIIDKSRIIAMDTPQNLKNELGGETILIHSSDNDLLNRKITEAELAETILQTENELNLCVKNAHNNVARIVELAVSVGVHIDSITIREPDLNDVFMHFTGREIRDGSGGKALPGMGARIMGGIK